MTPGNLQTASLGSRIAIAILLTVTCSSISIAATVDKLSKEEIVKKHLESIGNAEQIAAASDRVIIGQVLFSYRARGTGRTVGNAVLASHGTMSLIGMEFPNPEYPHERLGFDGRSFTTGFTRPGVRTVLGNFIHARDSIFKEGLILIGQTA